jgi:hypothetical protein
MGTERNIDDILEIDFARREAIESGVRNAVDTVTIDKAMSDTMAYECLKEFIQDALSSRGLIDIVSRKEMIYARSIYPLTKWP